MNRLQIIILACLTFLDVAAVVFAWRNLVGAEVILRPVTRSAPMIVLDPVFDLPASTPDNNSETLSRPLFVKSRRPFLDHPSATEANTGAAPGGLKLHAVIGFDQSVRAFVTSDANAEGKWLTVGDIFENWTVESIDAQEITLRQDADLLRIGLDYDVVPAMVGTAFPAHPTPTR